MTVGAAKALLTAIQRLVMVLGRARAVRQANLSGREAVLLLLMLLLLREAWVSPTMTMKAQGS